MIDDIKFWKGSSTIGPPIAMFDSSGREWSLVHFQPEQPVLEGELNLLQQASNRRTRDLLRGIYPDGGVLKDLNPTATGTANEIRLHTQNQPFYAILDGIMKAVYAYDDPASADPSVGGNRITLPAHGGGTYDELVYLEVWFEEIKSPEGGVGVLGDASTTVYDYGMTGQFSHENDIRVAGVPLPETTRRVQLRGEIRVTAGNTLTGVLARDIAGFGYGQVGTTNFWRAGSGTQASGESLDSVDGFVYAIPLVLINRSAAVVEQAHISIATDVIPTGSDVVNDLLSVETRVEALEDEFPIGWTAVEDRPETATRWPAWDEVTSKPATFPPSAHTHPISDVVNLQTTLDGKSAVGHTHPTSDIVSGTLPVVRGGTGKNSIGGTSYIRGDGAGGYIERSYAQVREDLGVTGYTELDASDIVSGVFPVVRGGTGRGTLTQNSYLVGDGTNNVILRTPDAVLSDIGAAAVSHTHPTSDIVSGTLPIVRGGTGKNSIGSTNFIRGDGSGSYIERTGAQVRSDIGAAATSHTHAAGDITSGTLSISRIPTGTSWNTVAVGNHSHTEYAALNHVHATLSTGNGLTGSSYNGSTSRTWSLTSIAAGSSTVGALAYNGTSRSSGQLYGGTSSPSSTTRLNYDGNLHARNFVCGLTVTTGNVVASGFLSTNELYVYSDAYMYNIPQAEGVNVVRAQNNKLCYETGSTRRIKQDIREADLDEALHLIERLNPVLFRFKSGPKIIVDPEVQHWGFIAEDVAEVDPRLARIAPDAESETPRPQDVRYNEMIAPIFLVVKEQQRRIQDLERRLQALEA